MSERVLVVGAGIAGLWTALALYGKPGRDVIVLDRDPPPPADDADTAFETWERKGVGHLRHSHAFLARLYQLIRDRHPELLQDLLAAGARELRFADGLPETLRDRYTPEPGDDDLTILTSRRTTLELVMRRFAARQDGITFLTEHRVHGPIMEKKDGRARIVGLNVVTPEGESELRSDLIVDASGKNTLFCDWFAKEGIDVPEEVKNAGILYYTRHYRLNPGIEEPERGKVPGAGDLGFLKYGVFPADNRCFSITLAIPEEEMELRKAVMHPEQFDKVCSMLPGIATWTSTETATGNSRVYGMGKLESRWREWLDNGVPKVAGFVPLGDSYIRTNPLYGRGCSFAAVQADILRQALDRDGTEDEKILWHFNEVAREVKPYYDNMQQQDQAAIKRSLNSLNPGYKLSFRAKLAKSFTEDAIGVAVRDDLTLLREAMKGFHMLEAPDRWLKRPRNSLSVLTYWVRGKKRNAHLYPPKLGPGRTEMLTALGIDAMADPIRLGFEAGERAAA